VSESDKVKASELASDGDAVLDAIRRKLLHPEVAARMPVRRAKVIVVTAAEIRKAAESNPGHRVAKVYRKAVAGKRDKARVAVDAADLQALLANVEVKTVEEIVDGARVITKLMNDDMPLPVAESV
jgi:hypothetical protein